MSSFGDMSEDERMEKYEREVKPIMERCRQEAQEAVGGMSKQERMAELERQLAASSGDHAEREGHYTRMLEAIKEELPVGLLANDAMQKIQKAGPESCFNDLNTHQRIICANIICYVISDTLRSGAIAELREYKRGIFDGESTEE